MKRLGFDVYLFEQMRSGADPSFFDEVTRDFGLQPLLPELAGEAEVLINISGHATLDWVVNCARLSAYIDTDPGFTQIWHRDGLLHPTIAHHTHHFSVGLNLGREGCVVPDDGIQWRPSPPPVVLEHWPQVENSIRDGVRFTTVATWRSPSGLVSLDGETLLPSKLHEFRRVLELPSLAPAACFEIALGIQPADAGDREKLLSSGWKLVDPRAVAGDPKSFRHYVGGSGAEFSTVQGVYSAAKTGWISDRSVRYLASGRPVLVQDTGVSKDVAGGEGMLTFSSLDEARRGTERIAADYGAHSAAARRLAEMFFDSDRVLGDMLEQMGARP
jgi:hypothetical protein